MNETNLAAKWVRHAAQVAGFALGVGVVTPVPEAHAGLGMFADCVAASGAVFYDAHWCGNCAQQRDLFRGYARRLKIVECYATGDSDNLRRACKDAGVRSFPTWIFGDGARVSGLQTIDNLAAKTGCAKP